MKFVFNVEKLKSHQIHHVKGHNLREGHNCDSQLENKAAWVTEQGRHTITPWNAERLADARKLSKRKDAVEAISIVIQVGNQTDWREAASNDCPEGKPKGKRPADLNALAKASKEWAEKEFGKENVVSIEAHTDESTPHFHVIVTPIKDGKLQAKHWLNGHAAVAALRSRAHSAISLVVPCEYEKGREGGAPHDPSKGAGKDKSPNQQPKPEKTTGLFARLTGSVEEENERLSKENSRLQAENHTLVQKVQYSQVRRVKAGELEAVQHRETELKTKLKAAEDSLKAEQARRIRAETEVSNANYLLDALTPEQRQWLSEQADSQRNQRIEIENHFQKLKEIRYAMIDAHYNEGMQIYAFDLLDDNPNLHAELREFSKKIGDSTEIESVYSHYEARNSVRRAEKEKTTQSHQPQPETRQNAPKRPENPSSYELPCP